MKIARYLLKTMRPRQWTKNAFVFGALVFDGQFFLAQPFLRTFAGFWLFCLLSGVVYIINDLADLELDRRHPEKRLRPLPSGKLPVRAAQIAAIALPLLIFPAAALLDARFAAIAALYFAINLAYSKWLKHIPILDVLLIAAGFVLRVGGGVVLIEVQRFSPWLYVVTTLFALYIGFGKRRAELALISQSNGGTRKVLDGYTLPLLDQLITIVSGATVIAYSLYTFSAPNLPANHTMMLTIPFVLYGIFRYLYVVQVEQQGGAPEEVLLNDRPLQITVILWALAVFLILYLIA
ncbi:MAG: decaprenyl-phosphate phosphoribosyltransferase [Anaerolineales bacterium]